MNTDEWFPEISELLRTPLEDRQAMMLAFWNMPPEDRNLARAFMDFHRFADRGVSA